MKNGMRRRMALLLACAMMFTSIDSSVLLASAAEVTDDAGHVHSEAELQQIEEYAADEVVDEEFPAVNTGEADGENSVVEDVPVQSLDGQLVVESIEELETEPLPETEMETEAASEQEVAAQAEKTVSGIAAVEVPRNTFVKGLDFYIVNGTKLTLQYMDNTTETYTLNAGWNTTSITDSYGNVINYSLKQPEEENSHHPGEDLPEGDYLLEIQVGEQTFDSEPVYRLVSVEDSSLEVLNLGDITFSGEGDGNWKHWYTFTAPEDGKYKIAQVSSGMDVRVKTDTDFISADHSWNVFAAEAGKTYYLGFSGTWDSETQRYDKSYTCSTTLSKVIELTEIRNVIPSKEFYLSGLENGITGGTQLTVAYSDGTSCQITLDSNSYFQDEKGNDINICLRKKGEEEKTYSVWENLSEGMYALELSWTGRTFVSDYIYTVKSVENSELDVLTLGDIMITGEGTGNQAHWYKFTAPEDGKYKIEQLQSGMSIRVQTENGFEIVQNQWRSFSAEAGKTYYLAFNGKWNESTSQWEKYTWTTTLSKVIEMTEIREVIPSRASYLSGLDGDITMGTQLLVGFSDGTSQQITLYSNSFTDEKGSNVWVRLRKKGDTERIYDTGEMLPEGEYALRLSVEGEALDSDYIYTVKSLENSDIESLTTGDEVTLTGAGGDELHWYKFVAPENGKYRIHNMPTYMNVKVQTESGLQWVNPQNGGFKTEAGKTYYLGFKGRWNNMTMKYDEYTWTTTFSKIMQIQGIADITPKKTVFVEGLDSYITNGTELELTYENGVSTRITLNGNPYTDEYGNQIDCCLIKENEEENTYGIWDTLEVGNYAIRLRVDDEVVATSDYVYQVRPINEADLTLLSPGTVTLTSGENGATNWYRMEALESGIYGLKRCNGLRVYELVEGDLKEVMVHSGWFEGVRFSGIKDHIYYLGISGGVWDYNTWTQIYTWDTELSCIPGIAKIEATPDRKIFYEEVNDRHICASVTVIYADGSEYTVDSEEGLGSDRYGTSFRKTIRKKDDDESYYDEWSYLNAGIYIVHIGLDADGDDEEDAFTEYEITVREMPSPFNGLAEATPLADGQQYRVVLDAENPVRWFSYTPEKDTRAILESLGYADSRVELFDASGDRINEDDDGGEEQNFRLLDEFSVGETYYFKVHEVGYVYESPFRVLFTECPEITALEVVSHKLKAVYLAEKETINPDVFVKATYSNGTEGSFSIKDRDSYGNRIKGRVVSTDTKEAVLDYSLPGTYLYQIFYGDIVKDVATFQVVRMEDYITQPVTVGNGAQAIPTQGGRLMYRFSADALGIYKLESNIPFESLRLYNTDGEEVPVRGLKNKYLSYVLLQEGDYYAAANVKEGVAELKLSVDKSQLPTKVSVNVDSRTLISGIDELSAGNLSTRVQYQNGDTATVNGIDEDIYGNCYRYEIENSRWNVGDVLPAGTYTIRSSVIRTGTSIYATGASTGVHAEENEFLRENLPEESRQSATIKVVMPDLDNMETLQKNVWTEATGENVRHMYKFTAPEEGEYELEVAENGTRNGSFYRIWDNENGLDPQGDIVYLEKGESCVVVVTTYNAQQFRVVKQGDSLKEEKVVKSIRLITNKDYVLRDEWPQEGVSIEVTYADETVNTYDWCSEFSDPYDNYFEGSYELIDTENGYAYTAAMHLYKNPEIKAELTVPVRTVKEAATMLEENVPLTASKEGKKREYYGFRAKESGEYTFNVVREKGFAYPSSYEKNRWGYYQNRDSFLLCDPEGGYIYQNSVNLNAGEVYYIRVNTEAWDEMEDQESKYTISVSRMKQVKDIEIVKPQDYSIYAGLSMIDYRWVKLNVTYEDGTSEVVENGKSSAEGRYMQIVSSKWINSRTNRTYVRFGDAQAYVDIPAKSWENVQKVTEDQTTELQAENGNMFFTFTPAQTGLYRLNVTQKDSNGYVLSNYVVLDDETGRKMTDRQNEYSLIAGMQYDVWFMTEAENTMISVAPKCVQVIKEHDHIYVEQQKDATCTEAGYRVSKCKVCGETEEGSYEEIPALGHQWQITDIKEATDTEEGIQAEICGRCKEEKEDSRTTIPMKGHQMGEWHVTEEATCEAAGKMQRSCEYEKCVLCKDGERFTETESIPALGHEFGAWTATKPATCENTGEMARSCSRCKQEESKKIPATGHTYVTETKEATCTESGYAKKICSVCGKEDTVGTKEFPKLEHKYGEKTYVKEATCTQKGIYTQVCERCGETVSKEEKTLPHDFMSDSIAATCTEAGYTRQICKVCQNVANYEVIPATGHDYGAWNTTEEATCTVDGSQMRSCTVCGETETKVIPAMGHVWEQKTLVAATEMTDGISALICKNCQAEKEGSRTVIPMTGHQFGNWSVTKEATCTEDGLRERSCTNENCQICNGTPITQKEMIPATGHDVTGVEWTVEKEATCNEEGRQIKKCTRCGEAAEAEIIQKKPHDYEEQREEATCTDKGYTQLICKNCKSIKEGSYQELPALGHIFGVGKIAAAPTCTEQGLIVFSCENTGCQAKRIGVLPTLEHTWQPVVVKAATCSAEGVQELRCVNCQEVKENSGTVILKKPHTWEKAATVDKAPTCTEAGVQSIHCEVCEAQMESSVTEIPALSHSYEENRVPATCILAGSITRICTRCGDKTTETVPKTGHNLQLDPTASSMATCEEDGLMVYSCQNENCNKHEYKVQGALGHEWDTENEVTIQPTETENGKTYQNCTRCSEKRITAIIPRKEQSEKIQTVNNLTEDPTSEDVAEAMDALQNIDDEILNQQEHAELISKVENALIKAGVSDKQYEETTLQGPSDVYITGATVAAAIEAEKKMTEPVMLALDDPDAVFALAEESGSVGPATVIQSTIFATKEEQKSEDAKAYTDYQFYMNVYRKEAAGGLQAAYELSAYADDTVKGTLLAEQITELEAPVLMTLPVPETYRGTSFKVMHVAENGKTTEQAYTLTADGTAVSFTTKALGTYRMIQGSCTNGHVFAEADQGTVKTEATCTTSGTLIRRCTRCKDEVSEVIPQTAHVYSELVGEKSKPATCAEEGTEVRKCENCDAEMTTTLAKTGTHTYGDWVIDTEATCTATGKKHKTCTICNQSTVTEEILALGHNWANEYTTDVAPTCISEGSESLHCTRCEATKGSRELAKTAHTFADRDDPNLTWIYAENCSGQDTVEVTCLTEGCTVTKTYRRKAENASAHTWDESKTVREEPTCTEDGRVTKICASCDQVMVTEVLPKRNHALVQTPAKAATCTTEGTNAYWTCGTCQKVFANAAGTVETTIEAQKLAKSGHTFGGYVEKTQPTVLAEGTEVRTCTRCGATESQAIARLNGTIRLTTKKLPLQIKKNVQLSRIVTDLAAGDSIVSCVSSKPKVATVDNSGKVVGKSAGKANVTITLASGVSDTVTIVVQKKAVATSSIKNVEKSLKLNVGEKRTLAPVISPITTFDKVSYSSSNKKVATVTKKGVILAKKSGTAKITVKSGKKKVTVKVTVAKKAPTGMNGVPAGKTLKKGKSFTMKPKLTPSGAEAKITYRSSNKKVATVNAKGKVTAKKAGTATITVKAGGVTQICVITVK